MTRRLHIALTADPYLPVPPLLYGGIERVIAMLADGLVQRGHTVTLFAHAESRTQARLVPYGCAPHFGLKARLTEVAQLAGALWKGRGDFDVVHSFGRLAGLLPLLPFRRLPKIQSYQRQIGLWDNIARAVKLGAESLRFTACSTSVYGYQKAGSRYGKWTTIFNGVDVARYGFVAAVAEDAPLVFLGRLEEIKGPHCAIRIARAAGRRLILAGNRVAGAEGNAFFEREIEPALHGTQVTWMGPVDDEAKNHLLGSAAALLMPILWEEPFGIVMAEAMACGTPVIAFPRGSVPEVIVTGQNGFIARDEAEAAEMVTRLGNLNRRVVREDCEARFSSKVIVDAYERLYGEAIRAGGRAE